jgi:DNA-binding IclR family transcriptional regulator
VNVGEPSGALAHAHGSASTRSLSTARSVLRVLALLVERPDGVRADEVAERLGKSTSTAYYLLSSLCEEGFAVHASQGVYRPARRFADEGPPQSPPVRDELKATVDELFILTRRRSYLGIVRAGRIEIVAVRGRQGVPRMPGLGAEIEIHGGAHALAMGKVVLAELDRDGLRQYLAGDLRAYTEHTITAPDRLLTELELARRDGFAVDREEFDTSFCCVAAPIRDERGRFRAVLALSVTSNVFDAERDHLADVVRGVAARASTAATTPRRPLRVSGARSRQMLETVS